MRTGTTGKGPGALAGSGGSQADAERIFLAITATATPATRISSFFILASLLDVDEEL